MNAKYVSDEVADIEFFFWGAKGEFQCAFCHVCILTTETALFLSTWASTAKMGN